MHSIPQILSSTSSLTFQIFESTLQRKTVNLCTVFRVTQTYISWQARPNDLPGAMAQAFESSLQGKTSNLWRDFPICFVEYHCIHFWVFILKAANSFISPQRRMGTMRSRELDLLHGTSRAEPAHHCPPDAGASLRPLHRNHSNTNQSIGD